MPLTWVCQDSTWGAGHLLLQGPEPLKEPLPALLTLVMASLNRLGHALVNLQPLSIYCELCATWGNTLARQRLRRYMPRSCLWSAVSPYLEVFRNVCPCACHCGVGLDSTFAGAIWGPHMKNRELKASSPHLCYWTKVRQNQAE